MKSLRNIQHARSATSDVMTTWHFTIKRDTSHLSRKLFSNLKTKRSDSTLLSTVNRLKNERFEYIFRIDDKMSLLTMNILQDDINERFWGRRIQLYPTYNAISILVQQENTISLMNEEEIAFMLYVKNYLKSHRINIIEEGWYTLNI